ncbi:hypothetical protein ILUMI_20780, partial [Ignelater luminosus]
VAFTCLLAVVAAKPGYLGHAHLGLAGHAHLGLAGHAVAPGFGYSSVTAHAAPVVAHAAPVVAHAAPASVAHHVAVGAPAAAVAHHAAYAAPAVFHHAAPAAAITTHTAIAHHAALPAVAHHAAVVPAVAHHAALAAPVAYAAPVAAAIAAPVIEKTQYHAQDVLGQASYGHTEAFQHHHAVQDAAGNKVGSYSWVAPNGQVVAGKYVADALGYRVHSNAVPVGPAPVLDTPEVVAARSAHYAAHIAAKTHHHLVRRGIVAAAPVVAYSAAVATPLHYTAHYTRALVAPVVHAKAHLHYGLY